MIVICSKESKLIVPLRIFQWKRNIQYEHSKQINRGYRVKRAHEQMRWNGLHGLLRSFSLRFAYHKGTCWCWSIKSDATRTVFVTIVPTIGIVRCLCYAKTFLVPKNDQFAKFCKGCIGGTYDICLSYSYLFYAVVWPCLAFRPWLYDNSFF